MWPNLNKPPVKLALFQLRFSEISMKVYDEIDSALKNRLPIRKDNIAVGINLNNTTIPLGKSKLDGISDAKIQSYIYMTSDQKERVELLENTATYVSELPYEGWDGFFNKVADFLSLLSRVLGNVEIKRTSIRFVNRFVLEEFDNPEDYFTMVISKSGEALYPLRQYGFRLQYDIPQTNIYSIVNQSVENDVSNKYTYLLDIDVLEKQSIFFEKETILSCLNHLRDIKNKIFFDSITEKTKALCN